MTFQKHRTNNVAPFSNCGTLTKPMRNFLVLSPMGSFYYKKPD